MKEKLKIFFISQMTWWSSRGVQNPRYPQFCFLNEIFRKICATDIKLGLIDDTIIIRNLLGLR